MVTTKRYLEVVIGIWILLAAAPDARADFVVLFTDSAGVTCDMQDTSPGIQDIYILHIMSSSDGVRFRVEASPDMTMTYLSEETYLPVLEGDTQSGITFCYGSCRHDYVVLAKLTYMRHGTSGLCSDIRVVPHPDSNAVELLLCNGSSVGGWGSRMVVNPDGSCVFTQCPRLIQYGQPSEPYDFCQPVRSDPTTWGRIKSLYQ